MYFDILQTAQRLQGDINELRNEVMYNEDFVSFIQSKYPHLTIPYTTLTNDQKNSDGAKTTIDLLKEA